MQRKLTWSDVWWFLVLCVIIFTLVGGLGRRFGGASYEDQNTTSSDY